MECSVFRQRSPVVTKTQRQRDNKNTICVFWGIGGRKENSSRSAVFFFLGRRHDNTSLKVQLLLPRNSVVISQAPKNSCLSPPLPAKEGSPQGTNYIEQHHWPGGNYIHIFYFWSYQFKNSGPGLMALFFCWEKMQGGSYSCFFYMRTSRPGTSNRFQNVLCNHLWANARNPQS